MKAKLFFLTLFLCIFFSTIIHAQDHYISYMEGEVTIMREEEELWGDFDTELFQGDIIKTASDSLVIIELSTGSQLKLKENTIIQLDQMGIVSSVRLTQGSLFSIVEKLVSDQSFQVKTKSVVAGVRGTEFFMAICRQNKKNPDIWLCVNEGQVEVKVDTQNKSALVGAGKGINIIGGKELGDVQVYEWTKNLNWNTDPQKGKVKDTTNLDNAYTDLLDQDYF